MTRMNRFYLLIIFFINFSIVGLPLVFFMEVPQSFLDEIYVNMSEGVDALIESGFFSYYRIFIISFVLFSNVTIAFTASYGLVYKLDFVTAIIMLVILTFIMSIVTPFQGLLVAIGSKYDGGDMGETILFFTAILFFVFNVILSFLAFFRVNLDNIIDPMLGGMGEFLFGDISHENRINKEKRFNKNSGNNGSDTKINSLGEKSYFAEVEKENTIRLGKSFDRFDSEYSKTKINIIDSYKKNEGAYGNNIKTEFFDFTSNGIPKHHEYYVKHSDPVEIENSFSSFLEREKYLLHEIGMNCHDIAVSNDFLFATKMIEFMLAEVDIYRSANENRQIYVFSSERVYESGLAVIFERAKEYEYDKKLNLISSLEDDISYLDKEIEELRIKNQYLKDARVGIEKGYETLDSYKGNFIEFFYEIQNDLSQTIENGFYNDGKIRGKE